MSISGNLITETFEYDGGREVTVYVPPEPPKAVVFAGDGQLISQWGGVLEAAGDVQEGERPHRERRQDDPSDQGTAGVPRDTRVRRPGQSVRDHISVQPDQLSREAWRTTFA